MSPEEASFLELFDSLSPPSPRRDVQVYSAVAVPNFDRYRLAKDPTGAPALLVRMDSLGERYAPPPIRLQHLYVAHNVDCRIHRPDRSIESGEFVVVRCNDPDSTMIGHFLRIIQALLPSLGRAPSPDDLNKAIDQLAELFRAMQEAPKKAAQGIWAELLVINQATNLSALVDAWHTSPDDLYDFSSGSQRIEVKSATGQMRVHHFSLAQLRPPSGTQLVVASVLVNRIAQGCTVADLVEEISRKIRLNADRVLRLHRVVAATLGSNWRQAWLEAFDLDLSRETMQFFDPCVIPSVNPDLPEGVSDVHFGSDLSGKPVLTNSELSSCGGLLSALRRSRLL